MIVSSLTIVTAKDNNGFVFWGVFCWLESSNQRTGNIMSSGCAPSERGSHVTSITAVSVRDNLHIYVMRLAIVRGNYITTANYHDYKASSNHGYYLATDTAHCQ